MGTQAPYMWCWEVSSWSPGVQTEVKIKQSFASRYAKRCQIGKLKLITSLLELPSRSFRSIAFVRAAKRRQRTRPAAIRFETVESSNCLSD